MKSTKRWAPLVVRVDLILHLLRHPRGGLPACLVVEENMSMPRLAVVIVSLMGSLVLGAVVFHVLSIKTWAMF